jgi:hypothetical protein
MHEIIMRDVMQARVSERHRRAEREALALTACGARRAPTEQSTFLPHTIAELTRRVLTLLGARRPSPAR